jgi:hypothetical protein
VRHLWAARGALGPALAWARSRWGVWTRLAAKVAAFNVALEVN